MKIGNLRIVQRLLIAPQNAWFPFSTPFASNATQLTKVNSTVTAVATLKTLKLNFFISLWVYLSVRLRFSRSYRAHLVFHQSLCHGGFHNQFTDFGQFKQQERWVGLLKFIQKLNHFFTLHDQITKPVIADAVSELVREFQLSVSDDCFEVLK